ncbi:MAG: TolC family protein, partial [Verrucomicrobia bacterium]|nr:TolC family protein [Verrucomicrobiota bacterium]
MKTLNFALLFAALAIVRAAAAEPAVPTNAVIVNAAFINTLVEEIRTNHPALRAARSRADVALFTADAVRKWDDPMFTVGGSVFTPRGFDAAQQGDLAYGIEQKLPLWRKPELAKNAAVAEAAMKDRETDAQFQVLRRDLTKTLLRVALADRSITLTTQDASLHHTMIALMEERYRLGQGTQAELILMQAEHTRLRNLIAKENDKLTAERASLNRLLGRELASPWPSLGLPPLADAMPFRPALVSLALENEPKLKVMREGIKAAQAATRSTKASRLPDFYAGVGSRQFSGDAGFREVDFTLRFNMPWGNAQKYRSDLLRDEARTRSLEADVADSELGLRDELFRLTVQMDAARREALLYRDEILPRTEAAVASSHEAWLAGRGMVRDILDLRRLLLDANLMIERAVAEQHQTLADLLLSCGVAGAESLARSLRQAQPATQPKSNP